MLNCEGFSGLNVISMIPAYYCSVMTRVSRQIILKYLRQLLPLGIMIRVLPKIIVFLIELLHHTTLSPFITSLMTIPLKFYGFFFAEFFNHLLNSPRISVSAVTISSSITVSMHDPNQPLGSSPHQILLLLACLLVRVCAQFVISYYHQPLASVSPLNAIIVLPRFTNLQTPYIHYFGSFLII